MCEAVIGIDRGASFTDLVVVEGGVLGDRMSIETRDWNDIDAALTKLLTKSNTRHLAFTGASGGMPPELRKRLVEIPEIEAIGWGGARLANCKSCLVASMGTGSAMVHVDGSKATHMGGTGVGGGTLKGLATLLCATEDPAVLERYARDGDAANLNLTIGDLGCEALSFLPAHATVSNFADIKSHRVEDKAAAILSLVGETMGIIASLCAREAGCSEDIVAVGKVSTNIYIRSVLDQVGALYHTRFLYPVHPEFATAYGAAVKYGDYRG